MHALTYTVTKSSFKSYINLHITKGYAYETDTHFVHQYGADIGLQTISIGLTAIEQKNGTLRDWIVNNFGATDIETMQLEVGFVVADVWRPGLLYNEDTSQALSFTDVEMHASEQALRLLLTKLDELFIYIEPCVRSMDTYSYKTRELLILACTEVEDRWKTYLQLANVKVTNDRYTTKDYVKLVDKLYLREYEFTLKSKENQLSYKPFSYWQSSKPTASLDWYDAYNKTKHDKTQYFEVATLGNCINAVVANLIMHSVRYSPNPMLDQSNLFANLVQQYFTVGLVNCRYNSFYLYGFEIPKDCRNDFFITNPRTNGWTTQFEQLPLVL